MEQVFAGIDLGGTNIKYGLCRSNGKVLLFKEIPAFVGNGPKNLLARIQTCAEELLSHATAIGCEVKHLGLGTPGVVDATTGKIIGQSPNIPGWKGTNPKKYLEPKLNIPVFVDNDVNVMALAESIFGAAKGSRIAVTTTVGTGVGGAIIINGNLFRGASGAAGEFGHTTIIMDGERCNCGRNGCLERYASAGNLIRIAVRMLDDSPHDSVLNSVLKRNGKLTIKDIFDAFSKQSDPIAERAIKVSVDYLTCGLASILAVINPELVVIGGGVADAGGTKYVKMVAKQLKERAFAPTKKKLRVVKAKLGNSAGFIGASILGEHI